MISSQDRMTLSEIHVVMVSGFATIAGTTMAAYITFGVSPAHLGRTDGGFDMKK